MNLSLLTLDQTVLLLNDLILSAFQAIIAYHLRHTAQIFAKYTNGTLNWAICESPNTPHVSTFALTVLSSYSTGTSPGTHNHTRIWQPPQY